MQSLYKKKKIEEEIQGNTKRITHTKKKEYEEKAAALRNKSKGNDDTKQLAERL